MGRRRPPRAGSGGEGEAVNKQDLDEEPWPGLVIFGLLGLCSMVGALAFFLLYGWLSVAAPTIAKPITDPAFGSCSTSDYTTCLVAAMHWADQKTRITAHVHPKNR